MSLYTLCLQVCLETPNLFRNDWKLQNHDDVIGLAKTITHVVWKVQKYNEVIGLAYFLVKVKGHFLNFWKLQIHDDVIGLVKTITHNVWKGQRSFFEFLENPEKNDVIEVLMLL